MSFIERNPVTIGIVTALITAVITIGGLSIQGSDLRGGYTLTALFEDAAGLRPGASARASRRDPSPRTCWSDRRLPPGPLRGAHPRTARSFPSRR